MIPERVTFIEWLGRGGIAQTTDTWNRVATAAGLRTEVLSKASPTFPDKLGVNRRMPTAIGGVELHRRLVKGAAQRLLLTRPDVVYVQNYLIPALELPVLEAARRAGSHSVLAVHNHRPHEWRAGLGFGLGRLVAAADAVVAHSEYVAERLTERFGQTIQLVEHPAQLGLLATDPIAPPELSDQRPGRRFVTAFGVLRRGYKGTNVLQQLAEAVPAPYELVAAGAGASTSEVQRTVDRFLSDAELHWLLQRSALAVLPYRRATQSGAVVLAQNLGAPPISTAVGGIPEQIQHGETGWLLPAAATPSEWRTCVSDVLRDEDALMDVSERCRIRSGVTHARAEEQFLQVLRAR